jgi:hypothetical protein
MRILYALRSTNDTLPYGRADHLGRELPKNGDVPKSPLPENGSLMPSAARFQSKNSLVISNAACVRREHFREGLP